MVTCEASGARELVHDSKHEASSGRTNNARIGREHLGSATRGACGQGSHGGEMIMLRERAEPGGQTTLGWPAQAGQPTL
jgi:hypothetical protein